MDRHATHSSRRPVAAAAGGLAAGGVYGWWVAGLPPFSTEATVAVIGSGLVVLLASRSRRAIPAERIDVRSRLTWGTLVAALVAWQLNAFVRSPRAAHPTLSWLANAPLEPRPVRAVAFAAWLAGAAWIGRR